jgi:hypothetical protein
LQSQQTANLEESLRLETEGMKIQMEGIKKLEEVIYLENEIIEKQRANLKALLDRCWPKYQKTDL